MFKLYMNKVLLIFLAFCFISLFLYFYSCEKEGYETNVSGIIPDNELKDKLSDKFNAPNQEIYSFNTDDDTYKCHFYNSKAMKKVPFIRTIIPEEVNDVYIVDTTRCSTNAENCSNDLSNNIDIKLFYDNVDHVDYTIDRNKTFLHLEDGKTYKDFDMVSPEEMPMTYKTTYDVCVPKTNQYDSQYAFNELFPCGVLQCHKASENVTNIDKNIMQTVDNLVKNEHQTKIDGILKSIGFKNWVDNLNTVQERNTTINEFCDKPNSDKCISTDNNAKYMISHTMNDGKFISPQLLKCYADKYDDLKNAFGYNYEKLQDHWNNHGKKEGRVLCGENKV